MTNGFLLVNGNRDMTNKILVYKSDLNFALQLFITQVAGKGPVWSCRLPYYGSISPSILQPNSRPLYAHKQGISRLASFQLIYITYVILALCNACSQVPLNTFQHIPKVDAFSENLFFYIRDWHFLVLVLQFLWLYIYIYIFIWEKYIYQNTKA